MTAHAGIAAIGAIIGVPLLIAVGMTGAISAMFSSGTSWPSATALADIPTDYLALYREATVVCPGLDWSIVAAIGKIETDHGRSTLPGVSSGQNPSGAGGPLQFLAGTFTSVVARHPLPAGGASPPSRYDKHDAIYAAAYYLCDSGADRGDLQAAIFAYNHAQWYVDDVLAQAEKYSQAASHSSVNCGALQPDSQLATPGVEGNPVLTAVGFACAQLGQPYVWGGDGPDEGGWDCSGLTKAAYAAAGIGLPRVAQDQYDAGPLLPAGTPLQPGDLVFFGASTTSITHVGIAISPTEMINAPEPGTAVRVDKLGRYLAAARPAIIAAS